MRRVRFRQSGGFAGLVRGCEVAAEDLPPAERRALERYVAARSSPAPGDARARDLVTYELEIETDAGVVRLAFDESGAPAELEGLMAHLQSLARPMQP